MVLHFGKFVIKLSASTYKTRFLWGFDITIQDSNIMLGLGYSMYKVIEIQIVNHRFFIDIGIWK